MALCCVVNCKSRRFRVPNIKYYRFPEKQLWGDIRCKQWIAAVGPFTADGKLWEPSQYTRICSLHFEGGSKSDDCRLPSYIPTLFPSPCVLEQKEVTKANETRTVPKCCIVNCRSNCSYIPNLTFYEFPKPNRNIGEEVRRKQWIAAVAPFTVRGKLWRPSKYTKLCSLHFEGGKQTDDPQLTSYIPTIFPSLQKISVKKAYTNQTNVRISTYKKSISKSVNKVVKKSRDDNQKPSKINRTSSRKDKTENMQNALGCQSDGIQKSDDLLQNISKFSTHVWNNDSKCEATQPFIDNQQIPKQDSTSNIGVSDVHVVKKQDNNDNHNTNGFLGYSEELEEFDMIQLSGVSHTVFHILLEYIPREDVSVNTLSAENRLLLLMMKMKHGLPFCVLGLLFKVSAQTASEIFCTVLDILYKNLKSWIKWPRRNEVPFAFTNYPECRAMIDFIQIRSNTPLDSLNESYKSNQTIKFLIATSPSGIIIYISKQFKHRHGTTLSRFMDLLEPGDTVMANKYCFGNMVRTMKEKFLDSKYNLVTPTSASSDPLFTVKKMFEGGVNVAQIIQKLKMFQIMEKIDPELIHKINKIVYVVSAITNTKDSMKIVKAESIEKN